MPEPTDPTNPLSHFDPEVPMPLSAADIRRRGDRLRRRNAGLAVAGGVAVIALIAAPLAVLNGSDDTDALPPTAPPTSAVDPTDPAPSRTPSQQAPSDLVTTIPDGFPLDAGYPDTNEDRSPVTVERGVPSTAFDLCQGAGFAPGPSPTDTAAVELSAPEDSRGRLLAVLADEPSAAIAWQSAVDDLRDCELDGLVVTPRESPYDADLDSAVFTVQVGPEVNPSALGLDVYEVLRVRNAVYLSHDYGEAGGTAEAARAGVQVSFEASADVVTAMRDVFGDGSSGVTGAPDPEVSSPPGVPDDDLSDFPLTLDWPDTAEPEQPGIEGPSSDLELVDYQACNQALSIPGSTGDLRATYTNVVDIRTRRLLTFADAGAAVDFMSQARAFYEDCPRAPVGVEDAVRRLEVRDTALAGASFAVVDTSTIDGEPVPLIGLGVLQFVRLGRAVLIDTVANERSRDQAQEQIDEMSLASANVVAEMCRFTEAGC